MLRGARLRGRCGAEERGLRMGVWEGRCEIGVSLRKGLPPGGFRGAEPSRGIPGAGVGLRGFVVGEGCGGPACQ